MVRMCLNIPKPENVASFWQMACIEILLFSCYGIFAAGLLLIFLGNSLFSLSAEICDMVARIIHGSAITAVVLISLERATITLAEVYFSDKTRWNFRIRFLCAVLVTILPTFWLFSDISFSDNLSRLIPSFTVILLMTPFEFTLGWEVCGMLMNTVNRLKTRMRGVIIR